MTLSVSFEPLIPWLWLGLAALPLAAIMEHRKDVVEVMDRGGWR